MPENIFKLVMSKSLTVCITYATKNHGLILSSCHCFLCEICRPSGALLKGTPNGGFVKLDDDTDDIKSLCCNSVTNMCGSFYQVRPSDTCTRYQPPKLGKLILLVKYWIIK